MVYLVVALYTFSLLFIFLFSLSQLHLTFHYLRKKKPLSIGHKTPAGPAAGWPAVTIQLPIYNEGLVVERLLEAVAKFDYPADKLEIQVLDDSTDESVAVIKGEINAMKAGGINVRHITRKDRIGYKAGALQYGLQRAQGEFFAIFDADFIPRPDFLKKTVPFFSDEKVGLVQTRWGHLNQNYSLLTRLQAFGLDAHFTIEQSGRSHAGSFINFNGTGGIWRKSCIIDAGGWSADTLTEDLDLSYRAQLKGWQFKFLEDVVAPAELPVLMADIKSQQFRWNKGAAETAKKNLGRILLSDMGFSQKLHACFHLLNSSVFVCLLLAALLSIPMVFIKRAHPELAVIFDWGSIFPFGFFSISIFYWVASRRMNPGKTWQYYLSIYPLFLTVFIGLSLHNSIAVLEGFLGFKSPFIRTPKFNIRSKKDDWKKNVLIKQKIRPVTWMEGIFCLYFIFGIITDIRLDYFSMIVFHGMLALGFASVFYFSVRPLKYA